jgi:hypothetical protein
MFTSKTVMIVPDTTLNGEFRETKRNHTINYLFHDQIAIHFKHGFFPADYSGFPCILKNCTLAQLERASGCEPDGLEFKSLRAHHHKPSEAPQFSDSSIWNVRCGYEFSNRSITP